MDSKVKSCDIQVYPSNSKKGKKLIPWRDPERGPILKAAMFKLAFTSSIETNKIYYKAPGGLSKGDQRWEEFHAYLHSLSLMGSKEVGDPFVKCSMILSENEQDITDGWTQMTESSEILVITLVI